MNPSIEVAKNLAKILDTTVGYLLGETEEVNLLKDPDMLRRLNDIAALPLEDKSHIIYAIDNLLASVKTRLAYK
jgi:transcriptional regulator with XRE-family HTH domain